ncbi:hypothetical protein SAMN04487943_106265 [Gracilibacillus orientalis]|uniref:Uncharacterized protein n=1 Tax=Gracilibacillus orientalis TaxID=334253 RepID=A0A1I4MHB8_9BACI|nr:hypothetical protein [Gracilibacillus orientalis]SFM02661.1 hypothetical protein SAMN04487943_106265 [Gracilibacillus orientalis]
MHPKRRFKIETSRDYKNHQLCILVYDRKLEQHFLYTEDEVENIPEELAEIKTTSLQNGKELKLVSIE